MLFLKFREPTLYYFSILPILLPVQLPGPGVHYFYHFLPTYNIGLPTSRRLLRSFSFVIAIHLHLRLSTIPRFGDLFSSVHLPVVNTTNPGCVIAFIPSI